MDIPTASCSYTSLFFSYDNYISNEFCLEVGSVHFVLFFINIGNNLSSCEIADIEIKKLLVPGNTDSDMEPVLPHNIAS
jgi:hypothetical protein